MDNDNATSPQQHQHSLSKIRRFSTFILVVTSAILASVLRWEQELHGFVATDENYNELPLSLSSPTTMTIAKSLAICTKKASVWPKPDSIGTTKYESVRQAETVLAFIISKLDEINAPSTLIFGTALHEYRNGTDTPCLRPKYQDKDFDMAVFPEHYNYILTFESEIREKFDWRFKHSVRSRGMLFSTIEPAHKHSSLEYFQIDVYGFLCNATNDRIFFPWDRVTIARDALLPLRKHKLIPSNNATNETQSVNHPGFWMPYDPPCLLHNIYGSDYMTPKSGASSQAKFGGLNGRPAYDNPKCNKTLTKFDQHELERQLMFCSERVPDPTTA